MQTDIGSIYASLVTGELRIPIILIIMMFANNCFAQMNKSDHNINGSLGVMLKIMKPKFDKMVMKHEK